MTPFGRIIAFILLIVGAAAIARWATRESLRPDLDPQEIGLRWLKDEYHLDDATFEKISALHREYFLRCDQMCRQIEESHRPLLIRERIVAQPADGSRVRAAHDQTVCGSCEKAATEHLRQVAALMQEEQGRRFLDDLLPVMQQQRRAHDENLSSSHRR